MLTIQPCTIADLEAAPGIDQILAEYADEGAIDGMPPPSAKVETYKTLEAAGVLQAWSAVHDGALVGYITVLVNELPHYSVKMAVAESFFVLKQYRKSGAGLKLLKAAEDKARELRAPGLLVGAPCRGTLFEVLPRRGYAETNRVFFKKLDHE